MMLNVTLPPELEAKLRARATEQGQSPDSYASKVLAEAIAAPTIDELLAPVRKQVAESGITEEELTALGRELIEKVRSER